MGGEGNALVPVVISGRMWRSGSTSDASWGDGIGECWTFRLATGADAVLSHLQPNRTDSALVVVLVSAMNDGLTSERVSRFPPIDPVGKGNGKSPWPSRLTRRV